MYRVSHLVGMLTVGEAVHVCHGVGGPWGGCACVSQGRRSMGISVPSSALCCEPKTALTHVTNVSELKFKGYRCNILIGSEANTLISLKT